MAVNETLWQEIAPYVQETDNPDVVLSRAAGRFSTQDIADTLRAKLPRFANVSTADVENFINQNPNYGYQTQGGQVTPYTPPPPTDPSRFEDTNVTQDPNRADPSNSIFDPLHMSAVQSVVDQQTQLQNSIFNNPNFIGPGGSTQTTTFGNMPDWEAYVRNHPDMLDDFLNNQAQHGITDIATYGQFHYSRFGPQGREVPMADASTLGYLQPTVETKLSPEDQAIFDANQRSAMMMAGIGEDQLGQTRESLATPFSTEGMYDPSAAFQDFDPYQYTVDPSVGGYEAISDAMMEREQPWLDRRRQAITNDLLVQGHNPGSEAWKSQMDDLNRAENDFRLGAFLQAGQEQGRLFGMEGARRGQDFTEAERAYGVGSDWRNQQLKESLLQRQTPLNELNALRTGSQVAMPTTRGYTPFGLQSPNVEGAAQEGYNRNLYQSNLKYGRKQDAFNAAMDVGRAAATGFGWGGFGG